MTARPVHPAFSEAWAAAWRETFNANPAYREAAAGWEGDIVLEWRGPHGVRLGAVYLDLWQGVCRVAREATEADRSAAKYLFHATREVWRQVLAGELSPAMAILSGRLRLGRGDLTDFLPYAGAATALLAAGGGVAAEFPDE